jgi:hypothetical protein
MNKKSRTAARVARKGMPPQLQRGLLLRRKRRSTRPLLDNLPYVDLRSIGRRKQFPGNWHDVHVYEDMHFICPGIKSLRLTRANIAATFYGSAPEQTIPVRWFRVGYGLRPTGRCSCGKGTLRFYKTGQRLTCGKCTGATYASRTRDKASRPYLAHARLKTFISELPPRTYATTRARLERQRQALWAKVRRVPRKSRRVPENLLRPRQAYGLTGEVLFYRK